MPPTRRTPRPVLAVAVTAVVLLALDAVWLLAVAGPLYRAELGDGIAEQFDPVAATAFYVLYVAALTYFAVLPGLEAGSVPRAAATGGFLGLTAYGTWALTNKAVLTDWPAALVPVDMAWGAVLSAVTAASTVALLGRRSREPARPATADPM